MPLSKRKYQTVRSSTVPTVIFYALIFKHCIGSNKKHTIEYHWNNKTEHCITHNNIVFISLENNSQEMSLTIKSNTSNIAEYIYSHTWKTKVLSKKIINNKEMDGRRFGMGKLGQFFAKKFFKRSGSIAYYVYKGIWTPKRFNSKLPSGFIRLIVNYVWMQINSFWPKSANWLILSLSGKCARNWTIKRETIFTKILNNNI